MARSSARGAPQRSDMSKNGLIEWFSAPMSEPPRSAGNIMRVVPAPTRTDSCSWYMIMIDHDDVCQNMRLIDQSRSANTNCETTLSQLFLHLCHQSLNNKKKIIERHLHRNQEKIHSKSESQKLSILFGIEMKDNERQNILRYVWFLFFFFLSLVLFKTTVMSWVNLTRTILKGPKSELNTKVKSNDCFYWRFGHRGNSKIPRLTPGR